MPYEALGKFAGYNSIPSFLAKQWFQVSLQLVYVASCKILHIGICQETYL